MTLLQQFNNSIKSLPHWAGDIKFSINMSPWPEKRKMHAIEIVEQLKGRVIIHSYGDWIGFSNLNIILSPKECDIASQTFNADNIKTATEYISSLLNDINSISTKIKFTLVDTYWETRYVKFMIGFEF